MGTSVMTGRTSRRSSGSTRSHRRRSRSSALPTARCWRGTRRLADGICSVGVTPERFRDRILPAFEAGAREVGRDPGALERIVWVPTSVHPDPAEALAAARLEAGVLAGDALETVVDPRHMEELGQDVDEATIRAACCVASTAEKSWRRSGATWTPARRT